MTSRPPLKTTALPPASRARPRFAGCLGLLLGLAIVKFGNPVIMETMVERPANVYEWLLSAWPIQIGYWPLFILALWGMFIADWRKPTTTTGWIVILLPVFWLVWTMIAIAQSDDLLLSQATCGHFITCVTFFYLGRFVLGNGAPMGWFWGGLAFGFAWTLYAGWEQHFGGLAETERYWRLYVAPTVQKVPDSFLKKMASRRIFGTLFYPNSYAGIILLVLPPLLGVIWSLEDFMTVGARRLLMGLLAVASLGALYWSGSKGGWLILLLIGLVALGQGQLAKKTKLIVVSVTLVLGLTGFFVKYASFFQKGATSVVARFDYWEAAGATVREHPVLGSGPGTFGKSYEKRKRPESEMAKMTHNDYLQQASDSGVLGALFFTGFIGLALVMTFRSPGLRSNSIRWGVWLGLLAWAVQEFFEFGLYIPAIAWVAFAFMGWLLGTIEFDRRTKTA